MTIRQSPTPLFLTDITDSNNSFTVGGFSGYYAKVLIRADYTGSQTLTVTNPATSTVLDTTTNAITSTLFYLVQNMSEPQFNVVTSTGTFTARVMVEYVRQTSEN